MWNQELEGLTQISRIKCSLWSQHTNQHSPLHALHRKIFCSVKIFYFVIAVSGRAASPIINTINRLYIAICWINCSDVTALSASVMVLTKNTFQWNWFYLLFCTLLLSLANMHAAATQSFLSWREIPGTRKNSHSSVESHLKYWYGSLSLTLTFFSATQYRCLT